MIKLSFRIILDEISDELYNTKIDGAIVRRKGDISNKYPSSRAKENLICYNNIYEFEKNMVVYEAIEGIKPIITFLNENHIDGKRQLWTSILSETDQFGLDFPLEFICFLVENKIALAVSGFFL